MTGGERLAKVAEVLRSVHFDGLGCGTHGVNACSTCYGPSPMDAHEVAEALTDLLDAFQAEDEARGAARVREAVEGVLDGYDFMGNALAKAVCEDYRDMIRARLRAALADGEGGE